MYVCIHMYRSIHLYVRLWAGAFIHICPLKNKLDDGGASVEMRKTEFLLIFHWNKYDRGKNEGYNKIEQIIYLGFSARRIYIRGLVQHQTFFYCPSSLFISMTFHLTEEMASIGSIFYFFCLIQPDGGKYV